MPGHQSFRARTVCHYFKKLLLASSLAPAIALAGNGRSNPADECVPPAPVPSPSTPGASAVPEFQPPAGNSAIPEFEMPAPLELPTSSQPLNTTASNFGGNLQSGLMMASSYAPAMLGDGFGGGSGTSGTAQTVMIEHFDASIDFATLSPSVDFGGNVPYVGTATGDLEIYSLSNDDTSLSTSPNFTANVTTLQSPSAFSNNYSFVEIQNDPAVQAKVESVGAAQFGPGHAEVSTLYPNDKYISFVYPSGDNVDVNFGYDYYYTNTPMATIIVPGGSVAAAPGAEVGRIKLTENVSPIPRDRVYVNYSYFNNTPLYQGGVNVNRVTPGFEKTFFGGRMSAEIRAPFATTLDSTTTAGGITNTNEAEFGNLTMYLKGLLFTTETFAMSGGLGIAAPTANDYRVRDTSGTNLVKIENESVHLLPFIGGLYVPNERFFAQGFIQCDVDSNGNPVRATDFNVMGMPTGQLSKIARPHDHTYMYFDLNMGYWLFLDQNSTRWITGVSPMVEYHLTQSVGGAGGASGNGFNFESPGVFSTSSAVVGVNFLIRNAATLTAGYATPLGNHDAQFDGEFRLTYNWFFGSSRPASRFIRQSTF